MKKLLFTSILLLGLLMPSSALAKSPLTGFINKDKTEMTFKSSISPFYDLSVNVTFKNGSKFNFGSYLSKCVPASRVCVHKVNFRQQFFCAFKIGGPPCPPKELLKKNALAKKHILKGKSFKVLFTQKSTATGQDPQVISHRCKAKGKKISCKVLKRPSPTPIRPL